MSATARAIDTGRSLETKGFLDVSIQFGHAMSQKDTAGTSVRIHTGPRQ